MKTFTKNYIGKGIKVENMDIVKVTLRMEDVQNYKHVYQDCEYITFEVAKMQQAEAGVVPWQMPWKSGGCLPRNLITNNP